MFYKMICDRVFIRDSKYNLDLIAELIYCAACVPVDTSSIYHQQLILEFASRLSKFKTFIPETIKIVESKINEIAENGERNGDFSSNSLYYLGFMIVVLYVKQGNVERAYFYNRELLKKYKYPLLDEDSDNVIFYV